MTTQINYKGPGKAFQATDDKDPAHGAERGHVHHAQVNFKGGQPPRSTGGHPRKGRQKNFDIQIKKGGGQARDFDSKVM